jgi:glycosyltransferase involved in cell wall biosynthesis
LRDRLRVLVTYLKASARILFFSPSSIGGVAEHTFYQARALKRAGARVLCLMPPAFLNGRETEFDKVDCLMSPVPPGGPGIVRRMKLAWRITANYWILAWQTIKRRPNLVLLDAYVEYLSPFWVWPHWTLAKLFGVKYAANLHDPVRNYAVGPEWWHRLSVRLAYLPLGFVIVHDELAESAAVPRSVRVVKAPHGLYEISESVTDVAAIRREWGVGDGQKVFLAFGFVRDGKNLDLAIQALKSVPEAFLVVAGSVASSKDKTFTFYRELAANLGVEERCRFFEGFVEDGDLPKYFGVADFVLLTYASSFHSQSGVLNLAARARKPVLASASTSALVEAVNRFALGVTVEPDSLDAVVKGMRQLLASPPSANWDDYETAASWAINARSICDAAELQVQ